MSSVTHLLLIVALVTEASRQIWRGGGRERELPLAHSGTFVHEMGGSVEPTQKKLSSAEPSLSSVDWLHFQGQSLLSLFCLLDCCCVKVSEVSEFPVISNKFPGRG